MRALTVAVVLAACLGLAWLVSTTYRPVDDHVIESCVIRDSYGDTIRLYVCVTHQQEVWQELQSMKQQRLHRWVGGFLLRDSQSPLGFRFDPENVFVAEVTAETFQTWLQGISDHLEYWLSVGMAYVWAEVVDDPVP